MGCLQCLQPTGGSGARALWRGCAQAAAAAVAAAAAAVAAVAAAAAATERD